MVVRRGSTVFTVMLLGVVFEQKTNTFSKVVVFFIANVKSSLKYECCNSIVITSLEVKSSPDSLQILAGFFIVYTLVSEALVWRERDSKRKNL